MDKVRVDKWLWAVRIFKSRTIAANACKVNNVKINAKNAKPSSEVLVGDTVRVAKNGFNFQFLVKELIGKRVGAPIAITCYDNITPIEELNKYQDWFIGKARSEIREKGTGRPTKRDRREIDEFKDAFIEYDWDED